jgi:cyclophilin family peptidyl-prolyl cis-trans isomerase
MRLFPVNFALALVSVAASAATDLPVVKLALPDLSLSQGATNAPIDLRHHFAITGITGQVAQFRTTMGTYNLELFASNAPLSVANFLSYVGSGRYTNTIIHRSDQGLHVIQGGGYVLPDLDHVATYDPIVLEYGLPNIRGTIAMARTVTTNSATSEWFINTGDNSVTLGQANGGGYAVFGRVTGTGMSVVDAIAALPVYQFQSPFNQVPLKGYTGTNDDPVTKTIVINGAEIVPLFPDHAGQIAVVGFSVSNSNPAIATCALDGSLMRIALANGQGGHADITVTATDSNGNAVQDTVHLRLAAADGSAGWYSHPAFGLVWDAGAGWFGGSAYGWMWDDPASEWIWSSELQGWLATTDPKARTLWSTQFRWLTPSATDPYQAETSALGAIYVGRYSGNEIPDSWVVSPRFGYVWANGDGEWFYSDQYGWLGVTADGGIWCVSLGRFL